MSFSTPFVRRPVATSLLALAVLLSGLVAFTQLPIAAMPRVDFPTLTVSAELPGASAETMAAAVAAPLERRLGRIAGLTEMTSASALGRTSITLQFELDRNIDAAARDAQAAIQASLADLPPEMPSRPRVGKANPADTPVLAIALTSETIAPPQLYDVASRILLQKLSQVPGVGEIYIGGPQVPAVRVVADPDALAAVGLSLADVRTVLTQASSSAPKGVLGVAAHDPLLLISANDQLLRPAEFEPLIVGYKDGAAVRLRDVARVLDDVENKRIAGWLDGKRAVLLFVRRQPGANVIEVIERTKALLPGLGRAISPAIRIELVLDRGQTIRASVRDVELSLLLSVALVIGVVFVFLRDTRATLIASVTVPLSIAGTFGAMYLLGYSLNNLSLMALTISIGFVIDDAIVVTENITRSLESGNEPLTAALQGARQIGFTVLSITASLLAVFIPLLLMSGMPGRLCREFSVTLSVAVSISAVVSLTLIPMLCGHLLRHPRPQQQGRPARILRRGVDGMTRGYGFLLDRVLRYPVLVLIATLLTLAASLYLYVIIPKGLFPQQDTGQLLGFVEAPQDISFSALRARQERANAILRADPDIAHLMSFVGAGPGTTVNNGLIVIALKPRPQRKASVDDIIARIRRSGGKLEGARLFLQSDQDIRIGARFARTQFQYTLQSASLADLNAWTPRVLERLRGLKELRDVGSDQQAAGLELFVQIDRDTAARHGIDAAAVDDALYDAFGQRQVAVIYTDRSQYRVVLEADPRIAEGPAALDHIYLKSASGSLIPLRALARFRSNQIALVVNHQGQFPSATLSFNLAPGVALGDAVAAIQKAQRELRLPPSVRASFQGSAQAFSTSLDSTPWLVLGALLAVYIVLGLLYESYLHPLTILSSLPSAGVGALLALLIWKIEFSIISLIGIILLIGIVKKNAILLIDFALDAEREGGMSPRESIRAACLQRFRPIMMTTLAALLGALPLALGSGVGSELRRPLGIAIVGGLLVSQLLTLLTTPVVYLMLSRLRRRPSKEGPGSHSMAMAMTMTMDPPMMRRYPPVHSNEGKV